MLDRPSDSLSGKYPCFIDGGERKEIVDLLPDSLPRYHIVKYIEKVYLDYHVHPSLGPNFKGFVHKSHKQKRFKRAGTVVCITVLSSTQVL